VRSGSKVTERSRRRIKATMLVIALQKHALGKPFYKGDPKLVASRVKAAQILLAKCMPDIQRTELTGADGGPVELVQATPEDAGI